MMTIRLPDDLEKRLSQLAKQTHRTKSYYVRHAIEEYLDDQEDYLVALSRMERIDKGIDKALPFEDLVEEYKKEHESKKVEH